MARYFFDIHSRDLSRDEDGVECSSIAEIRQEAMHSLPEIARDLIPQDGDRQSFTVLVRNEKNVTVYTATLTFAGVWLGEELPPVPPAS